MPICVPISCKILELCPASSRRRQIILTLMPIKQWLVVHRWWSSLIQNLTPTHTELYFWGVLSASSTPCLQWGAKAPPKEAFAALHPFSFHSPHFIFRSTWRWNVIHSAQQAIRSVQTLKLDPTHYNFATHPHPDSPMKLAKANKISFLLPYRACKKKVLFQCQSLSFDLDMKQREVSGTLHESGMQFLDQLVSAQRGVWSGGEGRSPLWQTSNTHSWCLRLASLITSSVRDSTGGSHIYYPICPSGGVEILQQQPTPQCSCHFGMDIVRQVLAHKLRNEENASQLA